MTAVLGATSAALAEPKTVILPGFSLGLAYTPDSNYSGVGWHAAGSFERLLGKVFELRVRYGAMSLEATVDDQHPHTTYGFITAEALAADIVSPVGGVGVVYVDLQAPLTDHDESHIEPGVNAGLRVLILHHDARGITIDGIVHHVFNAGPS